MRTAVALGVLALAHPALAVPLDLPVLGESSFDIATTTQAEYHGQNYDSNDWNDEYMVEVLRWHASLTSGETSLGTRIDGAFFQLYDTFEDCNSACLASGLPADACFIQCDHDAYIENDIRPERFWLKTKLGPVRLTAGDFPARFANGIALSVRTLDELSQDFSLRGGRVDLELESGLTVTALGGQTNMQNLDVVTQEIVDDPIDLVAGVRIEQSLPSGLSAGIHYVAYDFRLSGSQTRTIDGFRDNDEGAHVSGANIRFAGIGDVLDLNLEADHLTRVTLVPDSGQSAVIPPVLVEGPGITEQNGHALYGSMIFNLGDTTLILEGKDYLAYRIVHDPANRPHITYVEPPTLERSDMLILNNVNTVGGRVRLEHRLEEGRTTLHSNFYGASTANIGEARRTGSATYHVYGGAERRWDSGFFVAGSTGVHEESRIEATPDDNGTETNLAHVEGETGFPLSGPHAIEMKAWTWWEQKARDFMRGSVSLTYSISPSWAFSVLYGYTSEKAPAEQPRNYVSGAVSWTASDWLKLQAFGGRRMGGLLCLGGVCRTAPPFEGGQLTAIVQF